MYIGLHHTISATLPSTYQNLLKLVEISLSSDRNKKCTVFLKHGVYCISRWTVYHIIHRFQAPIHRAQKVMEYHVKNKIKMLSWPAQSPDLNIIERTFGRD